MRRIYVAGPMAGYADFNFPAFHEVARELRSLEWEVVNPAELDEAGLPPGVTLEEGSAVISDLDRAAFLRRDVFELSQCDAIVMLDGYKESKGANVELMVAQAIGLDVFHWFHGELVPSFHATPDVSRIMGHINQVQKAKWLVDA